MIAVGERKNKGRKKKEREKMSSFLFALRVNPFPTLEVITPRYIVGSARGTINRLQRSFFFSSPLREIAQSSSAPFPSSARGRKNFKKKKRKEKKKEFIRRISDPIPRRPRGPDFSRPSRHEITRSSFLAVSDETNSNGRSISPVAAR